MHPAEADFLDDEGMPDLDKIAEAARDLASQRPHLARRRPPVTSTKVRAPSRVRRPRGNAPERRANLCPVSRAAYIIIALGALSFIVGLPLGHKYGIRPADPESRRSWWHLGIEGVGLGVLCALLLFVFSAYCFSRAEVTVSQHGAGSYWPGWVAGAFLAAFGCLSTGIVGVLVGSFLSRRSS